MVTLKKGTMNLKKGTMNRKKGTKKHGHFLDIFKWRLFVIILG
jgi:hypothetical protein